VSHGVGSYRLAWWVNSSSAVRPRQARQLGAPSDQGPLDERGCDCHSGTAVD
jgi:hypothetical protein